MKLSQSAVMIDTVAWLRVTPAVSQARRIDPLGDATALATRAECLAAADDCLLKERSRRAALTTLSQMRKPPLRSSVEQICE